MEVQAGTFNPADFSWQGLTMTPAAAAHIRDLMRKQPDKKGLRLGIKTSGCAGFGYVLEMIAEPAPDDLLFESDGAKLFAPLQAMPFIDGTELDYVREGLNEIFKFHNPKAQHECGCGESFGVQASKKALFVVERAAGPGFDIVSCFSITRHSYSACKPMSWPKALMKKSFGLSRLAAMSRSGCWSFV